MKKSARKQYRAVVRSLKVSTGHTINQASCHGCLFNRETEGDAAACWHPVNLAKYWRDQVDNASVEHSDVAKSPPSARCPLREGPTTIQIQP